MSFIFRIRRTTCVEQWQQNVVPNKTANLKAEQVKR